MEIGKTLYVTKRNEWRSWLKEHHATDKEIWLVYYRKKSLKPRIPYNDSVEEALCFGWIDSIVKKIDEERFAQRFTPRRKNSSFSKANEERVRRLIKEGRMTKTGLAAIKHAFDSNAVKNEKVVLASDILKAIQQDKETWENFQAFPDSYKRIRIGWIEMARSRKKIFNQRLGYFLRMTAKNKKFGMVQ